jgi:integrase/recombinase XerD
MRASLPSALTRAQPLPSSINPSRKKPAELSRTSFSSLEASTQQMSCLLTCCAGGTICGLEESAATVSFKLSVIRSFFEYLKAAGGVPLNPASTKLVPPPELPTEPSGRALTAKEVRYLLSGPDREKAEGARDYALMLVMLRLSLRVAEVCALRASSMKWSHGRWTLRCKIKGGREEVWPLPKDVKQAIDDYTKLDAKRRATLHSDGEAAHLFQPHTNYRTLQFDKGLSPRMVQKIVKRWASFRGIGDVSPHDLRRTAITHAFDSGLTYRQVQMMSKHKDPKTVMRYDHGRELGSECCKLS